MADTLLPVQTYFNPNTGAFLAAGKVYSYEAGSSTPKYLHTGSDGGTNLANPVVLDAYGSYASAALRGMWGNGSYKIVVKDSTDAITVATYDNVGVGASATASTGNFTFSSNTMTAASGSDVIFQTGGSGTYQFKGTSSQAAWLVLTENTGNGTNKITVKAPESLTADRVITLPDSSISQFVVQYVYMETGAVATGTTVTINDDSIPQIGEGVEFMTLAITPKLTTNILKIEAIVNLSNSAAANVMQVALFQDAVGNALAATSRITVQSTSDCYVLTHTMVAGTTSATTFRIRAGCASAGTTTFNGITGGRLLGGVMASSIFITEYSA
jgi:hypothetical protein